MSLVQSPFKAIKSFHFAFSSLALSSALLHLPTLDSLATWVLVAAFLVFLVFRSSLLSYIIFWTPMQNFRGHTSCFVTYSLCVGHTSFIACHPRNFRGTSAIENNCVLLTLWNLFIFFVPAWHLCSSPSTQFTAACQRGSSSQYPTGVYMCVLERERERERKKRERERSKYKQVLQHTITHTHKHTNTHIFSCCTLQPSSVHLSYSATFREFRNDSLIFIRGVASSHSENQDEYSKFINVKKNNYYNATSKKIYTKNIKKNKSLRIMIFSFSFSFTISRELKHAI